MKVSCVYCGGTHDRGYACRQKPRPDKAVGKIERFRWTKLWKNKREEIRTRDKELCVYCLIKENKLTYRELSVHHIVSLAEDYSLRLEDDNLITLCRKHHEDADNNKIKSDVLKKMIHQYPDILPNEPPLYKG